MAGTFFSNIQPLTTIGLLDVVRAWFWTRIRANRSAVKDAPSLPKISLFYMIRLGRQLNRAFKRIPKDATDEEALIIINKYVKNAVIREAVGDTLTTASAILSMKNPDRELDYLQVYYYLKSLSFTNELSRVLHETALFVFDHLKAKQELEELKSQMAADRFLEYERVNGHPPDETAKALLSNPNITLGNGEPFEFKELIEVGGKPVSEIIIEDRR